MLALQILINSSVITVQVLLLAAALYLLHTVSGIFAVHLGAVMVAAAYTYYAMAVTAALPVVIAWGGAILIGMMLSAASFYLLKPLIQKDLGLLGLLVSISLMLGLESVLGLIFGASPLFLFEGGIPSMEWGEIHLNYVGIWTLILGAITTALAVFFVYFTSVGRKLRAVHQHRAAAQSLRLSVQKIQVGTYAIVGAIVALIGVLSCMNDAATPQYGTTQILPAFIAVAVGGVRSFKGVVITAIIMMLTVEFMTGMSFGELSFSSTWTNGFIFIFALIALLLRPDGLVTLNVRKS